MAHFGDPPSPGRDLTLELPDECLALIFHSLPSIDRSRCSLVCRRWLVVEGQSRRRLFLNASASLLAALPVLLSRFDFVSRLTLRCPLSSDGKTRADSIGDDSLALLAAHCPNLVRLKISACRRVSKVGMAAFASGCPNLRKLSCTSCAFGPKGIEAVISGCPLLEDLSIKRLRGSAPAASSFAVAAPQETTFSAIAATSLRSICLKEVYDAQCFAPLIGASPGLKSLKIIRCSGDWDNLFEDVAGRVPALLEVHLEKIQVGDRGLYALASSCLDLEVLHLVKTPECTDAGVIAVAERCHILRKLHIDGWRTNWIGDYSLMMVATGCPELQELVLIGVNPTVLSIEALANGCGNLERLALCGCESFGDAEMAVIAAKCIALRKLCVKGCPVSDRGLEALADGCPNLIKVKLKRCQGVTMECVEWLVASRGGLLAVSFEVIGQEQEMSMSEGGGQENGHDDVGGLTQQIAAINLPSSSEQLGLASVRLRNFVTSTLRRWSNGSNHLNHS